MFIMNDRETISEMYDRFIIIVNGLKNLGGPQLQEDLNIKLLIALSP